MYWDFDEILLLPLAVPCRVAFVRIGRIVIALPSAEEPAREEFGYSPAELREYPFS